LCALDAFTPLVRHPLDIIFVQIQFLTNLAIRPIQPHEV
jgi:hypothetical protein